MSKEPSSLDAYEKRAGYNQRISGYGPEVKTHIPCPWCAARDFMVVPITDAEREMAKEHTCKECGRSGKALIRHEGGGMGAELVQTGGPDAPEWMTAPPRRVDGDALRGG